MEEPVTERRNELPLIHLLPNLITLTAICAGLTAIRFGFQGDYESAVRLILLAGLLDGFDGRLARLLRCQSPFGAELDSLADFVNFGVAPGMILYAWSLENMPGGGWIAVLFYAVCCVLRLARFNVLNKANDNATVSDFFEGVPSPAGAVLAMLPMYLSFLFSDLPLIPAEIVAPYLVVIGLLMVSRIPTYSFKNLSVRRDRARFLLLGYVLIAAALLTYLWATLLVLSFAYIAGVIWAFQTQRSGRRKGKSVGN